MLYSLDYLWNHVQIKFSKVGGNFESHFMEYVAVFHFSSGFVPADHLQSELFKSWGFSWCVVWRSDAGNWLEEEEESHYLSHAGDICKTTAAKSWKNYSAGR